MPEHKSTETIPRTAAVLFVFGLALYLLTRFIALDKFPIYFFSTKPFRPRPPGSGCGVEDGWGPLPVYFENGRQYNLSLSVWQVLTDAQRSRLTRGLPAAQPHLSISESYLRDHLARHWWRRPISSAIPPGFCTPHCF